METTFMQNTEKLEICPVCGSNRTALRWMMTEPPVLMQTAAGQKITMESEKYTLARPLIEKCPACREALAGYLMICPRCHGQILGVADDLSCLQCGYVPRPALLPLEKEGRRPYNRQ
jgi:hypothetical protein